MILIHFRRLAIQILVVGVALGGCRLRRAIPPTRLEPKSPALASVEDSAVEAKRTQIRGLFQKAQEEFEDDRHAECQLLCARILEKDPSHRPAQDLYTVARAAKHAKADSRSPALGTFQIGRAHV